MHIYHIQRTTEFVSNASKRKVNLCVPFESTPNSIFMSIRAQSLVAHAFSSTSNTTIVVRRMMSTSSCPIVSPFTLNCADTICSSDHCGSWFASSYQRSHNEIRNMMKYNTMSIFNTFISGTRVERCIPIWSRQIFKMPSLQSCIPHWPSFAITADANLLLQSKPHYSYQTAARNYFTLYFVKHSKYKKNI